ncbi:MAG: hypothetical protein HQL19_07765 [Candidatus Omnitrophica bacterium]|nr:hypothetical protein [Candidatus Omnitrophota bacterium]
METLILKPQYDYFLRIRETLLPEQENKFVVIVGEKVVGIFDNIHLALQTASKGYAPGTFLIEQVVKNQDDLVQKFASMVVCFQ